jgi:site-specific recombinase XerD
MAYAIKRKGRFTAYYRQDGKVKSVGTYSSRAKALNAGLLAEEGEFNLMPENQKTFNDYLVKLSAANDIRVITRKNYITLLKKYAQPSLGSRRISAITKKDIKNLLDNLATKGISPSTISHLKTSLGSLFRLAVDDDAIATNPTHRIKLSTPKPDPTYTLEPKDFQAILKNLPTDGSVLLAQFLIASGCRYGEATELRVKDFNFQSKEVYVRRTVSDVGYAYLPAGTKSEGTRFLIVPATKNGNKRTVVLSSALVTEIKKFVRAKALAKEDLLFSKHLVEKRSKIESPTTSVVGEPYTIGSRTFQHATAYSYNVGGCRCQVCKEAVREYRNHYRKDKGKGKVESLSKSLSKRESLSKSHSRSDSESHSRSLSRSNSKSLSKSLSESHLPRDKWRAIWNEAINKSGIGWYPTTHDLRHANATQLLKNGVDVHEVKERLGHQSIVTTERYLHRIRHQQSNAAEVVNDYLE